LHTNI